jgi:hypothetical protein
VADLLLRRRLATPARPEAVAQHGLTAAAAIVTPSRRLVLNRYEWQKEVWDFYHNLGTFKYAMMWHSQTMSRVRLTAAKLAPGGGEPEPLDSGPAADLMERFFGGTTGQSQYMRLIDIQMQCPGEGYVVCEIDSSTNEECWHVVSSSQLQVTSGRVRSPAGRSVSTDLWQIEVDEGVWKTLPPESLVFRQWNEDPYKSFRPDSPARAALTDMHIISMMQKRIVAQSVSRLAANGVMFYPSEMTFPTKKGFENAEDPFTEEWLDITAKTINNPGSAQAAIPLPVKVPQQFIKDIVHMDFSNKYDERAMEIISFFYDRLATAMNMPKEVVSGMGDTSHWNAWSLDEQGVETHIKPPAEDYVGGVTKSYLHPGLLAMGESTRMADGSKIICWYDTSQLDVPPDRSESADAAYDRNEISGEAYRREKGFDDSDRPDKEQLREQILLSVVKDPGMGPAAIKELTGVELATAPAAGASTGPGGVDESGPPSSQPTPAAGPPEAPNGTGQPSSGASSPASK